MTNRYQDIFGRDILLSELDQAQVSANGELIIADGETAAIQDIRLRIFTRLGALFYDQDFGSYVPDFIHDENTKENRLAFRAEVIRRLELDPRVLSGSADCQILKWDEKQIMAEAFWIFWETEKPQNLSLVLNRPLAAKVLDDLSL